MRRAFVRSVENSFHVSVFGVLELIKRTASSCAEINDRKFHQGKDFAFHQALLKAVKLVLIYVYVFVQCRSRERSHRVVESTPEGIKKKKEREEKRREIVCIYIYGQWNILYLPLYLSPNGIESRHCWETTGVEEEADKENKKKKINETNATNARNDSLEPIGGR